MSKLQIVFDLGFGSSGKGQVLAAAYRDCKDQFNRHYVVRQGSIQAAHTVRAANGDMVYTCLIPCPCFIDSDCVAILGASCVLREEVLLRELHMLNTLFGDGAPTVLIDECATLLMPEHEHKENTAGMRDAIGSCAEGVGAATADRVMRSAMSMRAPYAVDMFNRLRSEYKGELDIVDSVAMLHQLSTSDNIYIGIEGTQGVLLNLDTSGFYPFTTSRQVDPLALMSQTGLRLQAFDELEFIGTMRTYPIRVGGNSGPMPGELSWDDLRKLHGDHIKTEKATLTKRIRRISTWDQTLLNRAIGISSVTSIALTFLDYPLPEVASKTSVDELTVAELKYIASWQARVAPVPIQRISTGPGQEHTFDIREAMADLMNPFR